MTHSQAMTPPAEMNQTLPKPSPKSTSSNHHSDSSPLHKDPVVVLTRLADVVVKTLLRDIKVCLVKEETDARRDECNNGGRTYCLSYSSLLPTVQFK
ncbi:hypothetical protein J4Q44_G00023120 [Coregonus suidteri]|uniref:Uncharacterized protein n=1 Tax=Coregonus suidteri TaxID=861788 RepID=A0AAN8MGH3_9TELE